MTLRELSLRPCYETLVEDPVADFYVPVLECSVSYDRIAGFFSSTSLALAARGIAGLIANGGIMRLIVCPEMSAQDLQVVRESTVDPQGFLERTMLDELGDLGQTLADDHVRALGWMLAKGMLELRVATVVDGHEEETGALFHQKVGLMQDPEGNRISFSGSINETASGWLRNSEEFKVFCEWDPSQRSYFESDRIKFDQYWTGSRPHVRVFEPSDAFNEHIMRLGKDFDIEMISLRRYESERRRQQALEEISLFPYQRAALEAWETCGRKMLFEMATGTGKTRTAIACVNVAKAEANQFVCVTAVPEVTLARQWNLEFEGLGVSFDKIIFADSSSGGRTNWAPSIRGALARIASGMSSSLLVLVTHASACTEAFTGLFTSLADDIVLCFVGDEVHGLGAKLRRRALLERYDERIGLSATPTRWFDEEGTRVLTDYFAGGSFAFTMADAQTTINPLTGHPFLAPYRYELVFVSLTDEEMDRYLDLSSRIARLSFVEDADDEAVERLLSKRADITKNAAEKLGAFDALIANFGYVDKTLVFTSPEQIDQVCRILARRGICAHPFTQRQGTRKRKELGGVSERQAIIDEFKRGGYQALVAIRCLDEGIDIPEAECAILLSSSTNPREYIQRIGRVVRYHEDKEEAKIYDFVVEPDWSRLFDEGFFEYERRLFERELVRVRDMAQNAVNGVDVLLSIGEKLEKMYGA